MLVEALLLGRTPFGIDLNPLACLLPKVKTTPLGPQLLLDEWKSLKSAIDEDIRRLHLREFNVEIPDFLETNITYWFKPYVIEELAAIKDHIDHDVPESKSKIRDFFYVVFSATVRSVSGTRNGEFKLYRIPKRKWKNFGPDVLAVFEKKANTSISKMGEFRERYHNLKLSKKAEIFEGDTRKLLKSEFNEEGRKKLTEDSINLIATSPPYGDSRTTVAYGQFSRYSLVWLGYEWEKTLGIDRESLGGKPKKRELHSEALKKTLTRIENQTIQLTQIKPDSDKPKSKTGATTEKSKNEKRAEQVLF